MQYLCIADIFPLNKRQFRVFLKHFDTTNIYWNLTNSWEKSSTANPDDKVSEDKNQAFQVTITANLTKAHKILATRSRERTNGERKVSSRNSVEKTGQPHA